MVLNSHRNSWFEMILNSCNDHRFEMILNTKTVGLKWIWTWAITVDLR
jgi:hypothetical protein